MKNLSKYLLIISIIAFCSSIIVSAQDSLDCKCKIHDIDTTNVYFVIHVSNIENNLEFNILSEIECNTMHCGVDINIGEVYLFEIVRLNAVKVNKDGDLTTVPHRVLYIGDVLINRGRGPYSSKNLSGLKYHANPNDDD